MEITKIKTRAVITLLLCAVFVMPTAQCWSDSFFEVSIAGGERQLGIFRKSAAADTDDAAYLGLALAAYRKSSDKTSWGGVIEILDPIGRDNTIGSGRILGFRPVNYLVDWNQWLSMELFMGAAQYNWINNASGYYLGGNMRLRFGDHGRYALGVGYKYFQDLAHDGGPGGDQIIDGPALGVQLHYRFGQ